MEDIEEAIKAKNQLPNDANLEVIYPMKYGTTKSNDFVLSNYIDLAMRKAVYEKFDDGTYGGRVTACRGVIAFGKTLVACQEELRSTLEDWILIGLKLGHTLPVIDGVDLNFKVELDAVETV